MAMSTFGMNLVVIEGPDRGQAIPLDRDTTVVGRGAGCDLLLHDDEASRRHAELRRVGDGWQLIDLGSTNGTLAGGQRLTAGVPFPLAAGAAFTIGHSSLAVQPALASPAPAVVQAPPAAELAAPPPPRAVAVAPG
jgi:pSer/pThr/pTyr-binding forkhead associated (FHA) protein